MMIGSRIIGRVRLPSIGIGERPLDPRNCGSLNIAVPVFCFDQGSGYVARSQPHYSFSLTQGILSPR